MKNIYGYFDYDKEIVYLCILLIEFFIGWFFFILICVLFIKIFVF